MTYVKLAPYNAPAAWKSGATLVLPGVQDYNSINPYLVPGNTVEIGPGNVIGPDNWIAVASNSVLIGQGPTTILNVGGIYNNQQSNVEVGNFNMSGPILAVLAGSLFTFCNGPSISNLYYHDIISNMSGYNAHFYLYLVNGQMSQIVFSRCKSISPDGIGFLINGEQNGGLIQDITFYRCSGDNAGIAPTRYNPWEVNFDFAEYKGLIINRLTAIQCTSNGAFESDVHFEIAPSKKYTVLLDFSAINAGQKPNNFNNGDGTIGPLYSCGFLMSHDPLKGDDFIVNGLTGGNNKLGDMRVYSEAAGFTAYTPPVNMVYGSNRTVTRITKGNCTGIAVWNAIYWDVYLYSSDQNPVTQTMVLPDGTLLPVVFTDFLIQRNIVPNGGISMWLPTSDAPIHWQWQIGTDFNINTHVVPHVTVYDIDGFTTSAATVSALHALGCKVIAYFSFGTYENWRPDQAQFTAAIKGSSNGWPGENWLDIRADLVKTIMTARIALAASKGFDAIEPDNIDGYSNSTGFPLTANDQLAFNEWIATTVHSYGMSVGLKNDVEQAGTLQPYFDWALNEECYKYSECSSLVAFINANKAVFQVEYSGTGQCSSLNSSHFNSMTRDINLTAPTDSAYKRTPCIPDTQDTWDGSPPPTGFVHGTVHTATFQATISPTNQSCQVEIYLGVNQTTKAATSGLTSFTSTGSAQVFTTSITLPAANTYNTYVDLYMAGVKIKSFTGTTTLTVT